LCIIPGVEVTGFKRAIDNAIMVVETKRGTIEAIPETIPVISACRPSEANLESCITDGAATAYNGVLVTATG